MLGNRLQSLRLTRMKSHAQPGFPPMPSILTMAAARRPEKALANEVAENNSAILRNEVRGLRKCKSLQNAHRS